MPFQTILVEQEGPLTWLIFNRPDRLNALDEQMLAELEEAVAGVAAAGTRILILTGKGRAFMAGADIRQFLEFDSSRAYEFVCRGSGSCSNWLPCRCRSWRRLMALPWGVVWSWLWPATASTPPPKPSSVCPK